MLRNMLRRSAANRLILGTPNVGILASTILSQTATGDNGPGLLYDAANDPVNAGKLLRLSVTSAPGVGTLFIGENGTVDFSGAPNGLYTIGYNECADNVLYKADTSTIAVGSVDATATGATLTGTATMIPGAASGEQNAVAPGATLSGSGSILPGAASGEAAGDATAPGAVLVGNGQIVPGAAEGQQDASAPGAVLTGSSSLQPGAASGDLDATAPGATLVGGGQFVPGNASDGTSDPVFALAVSIEKRTQLGLTAGYVTAYVWQEIALENVYYKGGVARLHCRVADSDGRDIDPPALSLIMRYGAGVPSELVYGVDTEIVRAGQGRYYADVPLTERGTMYYRWETGALDTGAAESSIVVRGGRFQ